MAEEYKRMRKMVGSDADWAGNDLVLGDGEVGFERASGVTKMKVGDGAATFAALEYAYPNIMTGTGDGQTIAWDTTTGTWLATDALILTDSGNIYMGAAQGSFVAGGGLAIEVAGATTTLNLQNGGASFELRNSVGNVTLNTDAVEVMRLNSDGGVTVGLQTVGQGAGTLDAAGGLFVNGVAVVLESQLLALQDRVAALEP